MKELSIIIPVYNNQDYLLTCLNSILKQTFTNFEIIIINDGSTDNSKKIIENTIKTNKNIKLINQKNQGQGIARNKGINVASGKYIMFIDSDDTLANKQALETIIKQFKKDDTDILIFGYKKYYKNLNYYKDFYLPKKLLNYKKISTIKEKNLLLTCKAIGAPWNKIYKKEFLIKHNLKFSKSLRFEDAEFFFNAIVCAKNISLLNKIMYIYTKRKGSSIKLKNNKNQDIIDIYSNIKDFLEQKKLFNSYIDVFLLRAIPSFKSQFKKAPFRYKKEFFIKMKNFCNNLNIEKNKIKSYNKNLELKKIINTNFLIFWLKHLF